MLIFHAGALGDFVLSFPLALAAARIYPQSRVFYVAPRSKGRLAEALLDVESLDIESGWHALHSDAALPEPAARSLASAHTIASFFARRHEDGSGLRAATAGLRELGHGAEARGGRSSGGLRGVESGAEASAADTTDLTAATASDDPWLGRVITLAPGARLFAPDTTRPADDATHITAQLIEQLSADRVLQSATAAVVESLRTRGLARWSPDDRRTAVIHPGSGSARKNWPLDRFMAVAKSLADRHGMRPVFLIGEVERERLSAADLGRMKQVGGLIEPASYVDLAAALSRASLFIGNDSGPGHLAGMLGVPTVTLFGPTAAAVWTPIGPRVRSVVSPTARMDDLMPEVVVSAAERALTDYGPRSADQDVTGTAALSDDD